MLPWEKNELVVQPVFVLDLSLCDPGQVPNLPGTVENGKDFDGSQSPLPVLIACELRVLWILFSFYTPRGGSWAVPLPLNDNEKCQVWADHKEWPVREGGREESRRILRGH